MGTKQDNNDTFRVKVDKQLVKDAKEEFNESDVKDIVRRSMEEGISSKEQDRYYKDIIKKLSEINLFLVMALYKSVMDE